VAKFEPGKSGNPAGRPVGARSKLGEAFIEAMLADFLAHGPATIERVRQEKPDQYLKVIASLMPREVNMRDLTDDTDDMTEEELAARAHALHAALAKWMH
jgi:Family of unknown function (DUF5681)